MFFLATLSLLLSRMRPSLAGATSPWGPIVSIQQGSYAGNDSLPGVTFFGGIPYAEPPLGNLRWRPPAKLKTYHGGKVVDARNWGPLCIQQPAVVGIGQEDCLTLNVWKPSNARPNSKLPVVIYIHGGGNYYNSAQGFPMNDWVVTSNGTIVAVNIQYRLGLLGFLASSDKSSNKTLTPNVGLLDQRAALKWVQSNIAAFGGDPSRVTISGESSGGGSVVMHLTAYGGEKKPPFSAAIAQSIGNDPFPLPSEYEACFKKAIRQIGCESAEDVAECLRCASIGAIISAVNNRGSCKFLPVIDGDLIRTLPSKALSSGAFAKVSLVAGHCTDDGSNFVGKPAGISTDDQVVATITKRYSHLSNATVSRMLELYPLSDFESQWKRAVIAFGDTEFTCLDWSIAQAMLNAGVKNVFNYRWNTPDPVQFAASPYRGVMHTSELFFLFSGTNSGPSSNVAQPVFTAFNETEDALATEALSYWTSFARAGNPSAFGSPPSTVDWQGSANGRLVIQKSIFGGASNGSFMESVSSAQEERCKFWMEVSDELRL